MSRANLWKASLLMVALTAACGQESVPTESHRALATRQDAVFSTNQVLILDSTVTGGAQSAEFQAVSDLGYTAVLATPEQWAMMSAEEFGAYRAIVLGDASCANLEAVSAAVANRHVWGPVVNGNILISGTAPVHNGAPGQVTEKSIQFASRLSGKTGFYASLSCYYQNAAPNTHVELLEPFGQFSVQSGGCHGKAHIVASHPTLDALSDETMSNWACSVGAAFDTFPMADFSPWSIAVYEKSSRGAHQGGHDFTDGTFGAPYVLARGVTLVGCGDGEQQEDEECDLGQESGALGSVCSATCRLDWCGDGVVNEGEDCDLGFDNGKGVCPRSCRLLPTPPPPPPPTRRPPVAVCKHLTLGTPAGTCGAGGSIDDGSYDADGDLVGCTQDVTSFGIGRYTATLTCTDAHGLVGSCTATINVVDSIAPEISCPAARSFECGMGSVSPEHNPATATDNCGTPFVTYLMEGESYALGTPRTVTWLANDGTNDATCATSVTMVDTRSPGIDLNGAALQTLECGLSQYTEAGATAADACAGNLTGAISKSGAVNAAAVGSYTVNYRVQDGAGNTASVSREVRVADTVAPSLALNGAATQALECGVGQYTEAGAVASDACAGDLTGAIIKSGAVNAAARGAYAVSYSVKDASGNAASAVRTVNVDDTLAPSVTLNGASSMRLECGVDSFNNPGATAADACSGNLTSAIVTSGAVNAAAVGSYTVSYSVQDGAGLSASAARAVQVADTQAPSLTLNGAATQALECGVGHYTEAGAVASDLCMGDLTSAIVKSGAVNAAARGAYAVTYRVQDASGNAASAVRTVSVNDTLAPSIALVGAASMRLECGVDSFSNPGATAADVCSGNLTGAIVTSGAVNAAAVGSYTVNYSVQDGAGLSASVARAVQVADTKAPSIALNGAAAQTLECGVGQYTEAGAVASDVCAGNLTSAIVKTGSVNAAVRGAYPLTYRVQDASGNAASVVRTVTVNDTKAPSIALVGSASMSVNRGASFTDPGATASDSCAGNLTSAIVKTGSVNTAVAGTYTLTYRVQDAVGLSASVTRSVTVVNACSTTVTVKPTQEIWPPNHKMQSFRLSDCASVQTTCGDDDGGGCGDNGGSNGNINTMGTILSIYSDEPEDANGNGDGNTDDDIEITGASSFKLRAERQGKGNGRVYGVRFKVTDSSGAQQTATCKFVVPHDQSGRGGIDDGAAAGYTVYR
ncbi:DUF5011 domain-containing protein [Hyalangium rubrum]|uniref:DUF5011 domain-containing protein n=1 Tax=Hyalangium rubrum TaxID=3103134 RepID=A0ABU5HH35_9BACT|nr:DUF5011 domain-containing protein [Hyalangium sp. s54d21]MDY7232661.1 DUF5011 domain-containing protein [Hyalangium sp. s54d21]